MGCYCQKSAKDTSETEEKTDLIQPENKTLKNSISKDIKKIEIDVDITNNNRNNKMITGSLIDKWKNQNSKKNKNKQFIKIKEILSEPEINELNISPEKEVYEKKLYFSDKVKEEDFNDIIESFDFEEIEDISEEDDEYLNSEDKQEGISNDQITIMAKLEKKFCINLPKKNDINKIYEFSNKRIAVCDRKGKKIKIYSLKTGKFITEIESENITGVTELKNSDLIIYSSTKIYFYKLLQNNHYELYKSIDENKQGTLKNEEYDDFCLYSVHELMNGNLLSCNSYGIKIYKKNSDEYYKLSFIKRIDNSIRNAVEIKKNLLFLFGYHEGSLISSFRECKLTIYKYDIEENVLTELNNRYINDEVGIMGFLDYVNYVINNNYLIIRFKYNLDIYDINQDGKLIDTFRKKFSGEIICNEIICNFDENKIVVRTYDGIYKILRYENKSFHGFKIFPFAHKLTKGIIKLKDNNFIIYSKNKIMLLNNLE